MPNIDIDIVERLEDEIKLAQNGSTSKAELITTLEICRLKVKLQAAEIERLRKIEDAIKARQEKTKEWCLCGIGINGDGQHSGYCTAYYSPNHSNLVPPTERPKP